MKKTKTAKKVPAVVERGVTINYSGIREILNEAIGGLMAVQCVIDQIERGNAVVEQKAVEMIRRIAKREGMSPAQLVARALPKAA